MSPPIHPRTAITLALVAKLRNPAKEGDPFPTQAGENVELNWPLVVKANDLPKVIVWAEPEEIEGEVYQDMPLRVLRVSVGVLATGDTVGEIDQLLDSIALEVERAVLADRRLKDDTGKAWVKDIKLSMGADKHIGLDKSKRMMGSLGIHFRVEYYFEFDNTAQLDKFLQFRGELILEPYLHPDPGEVDANADVDYLLW